MGIEAGQQLLHYRLIEKIGEGGMGVVWKAEDTKLQRHVALKFLPEAVSTDPERRARFEREARAVAALSHPNIVTLHSVEQADTPTGTVHFITMELVEGKTLSQLLPKDGFTLSRMLEIAIPLADAVSCAHRAGITHRDLKPDNIIIDEESRLRVLDFGLAKLHEPVGSDKGTQAATVTSDTAAGRVLGTVAYMSPEQSEGKNVDSRSDVFSLGTILYEMVSGGRPFRGDTYMSTIGAILKDEPASVTELNPSLPRHAGRIIRRCLAKDPDRRYQTALDLRNELEALKVEIDSGVHVAESAATAVGSRRSSVVVVIGAVVMIAIAGVLMTRLRNVNEAPPTGFASRPVTATIAWDNDPNWSADGKHIAFARMTSGNLDVYVKPVKTGAAANRAGGPGDQLMPRWAPDGRHLAYVSTHQPGTSVYLVPAYGGEARELIKTDVSALRAIGIWGLMGDRPWESDGKSLLVTTVTETSEMAVHRVDRATAQAEQVTFPPPGSFDSGATYSFDGKRILFRRQIKGRGALMIMPAEGGDPELVYQGEFDIGSIAWRPDNRHVVFHSIREVANASLIELDVATRESRHLFDANAFSGFSVSAMDRIVYSDFRHDTFLHVVDVATGEREQITSHTLNNFAARFSPDGRTIAYISDRTGNPEIWLHPLDGRPETQFTDNDGFDSFPEWSPEGQRLVFMSNRDGGGFKHFIANADGGAGARPLSDQSLDWQGLISKVHPASRWSPDGKSIAYLVTEGKDAALWTVAPDGEDARRLLGGITGFDWYRTGRHGFVTRERGSETELSVVDLEDGREETLIVGALMEFDVAPDGSAVAFCYGRGHMSMGLAVLRLEPPSEPGGLPRAVGEPEYVVRTEGTWHVHNGGWSPDSRQIVYTQDKDYGDIYELIPRR